MFKHINQNMSFLANTQRRFQPQFPQRGGMTSQNAWKVPFPHQNTQGESESGKTQDSFKSNQERGDSIIKNRRNKSSKLFKFSILGTNAAGLKAKKDSLKENIKLFNYPSVITVQETKYRNNIGKKNTRQTRYR